jgi:glycosyltransferase involved in cell wall biosynthesis
VRILHIAPNVARAYGGPTYSLVGYSAAAASRGVEVVIAAPRPPAEDVEWLSGELPYARLALFTGYGKNAFVFSPALYRWLRKAGTEFDVVHVHGLLNAISSLSSRLCVSRGWPVAIRPFGTLSGYTVSHRRGAMKQLYFAVLERPTLRRASALHFTTEVERDESLGHEIEWGARAFVIPPPVRDGEGERPRTARSTSNVLVIARLNPVKRLELLLDAWPLVMERVPAARLAIAGEGSGDYERSLRRRAANLGESVRFVGNVQGIAKQRLLDESDLFVLPSLHENFGIAVLEALAAGLPVVITPQVQLADFVVEHELGRIAEDSAAALADAIVRALGDSRLRARCRHDGARIVSEHFSRTLIGDKLVEMYRFAIAHPSG